MVHKNSHIVFIRRLPQFGSAARKELEEYFAESKRGFGGYFAKGSSRTATGLTPTEEDILMPYILNIPKEDRDFRKGVTAWFEAIDTKVPGKEGLALEIGLEVSNSEPVGKDNLPLNITDYIRYRHALGHPWVAESEEAGKGNQLKQYYVYDPKQVSKVNISVNETKDKAMAYYLTIKDNKRTVKMLLTLLGVQTKNLRPGEEVIELRKQVDQRPEAFNKAHEDKDKEIKYIIEDMINANILERVGTRILIKESGEQIGRDVKEAVLYLKDSHNTKNYAVLQARLQEFEKRNSISVDTDEDLDKSEAPPKQPEPSLAGDLGIQPGEPLTPAAELIPAAAPETQEAVEDSAGAIED